MPTVSLARCAHHAERPAFARCMACAKMLCQECVTQWDGIWYCAACLGAKRGTRARPSGATSWIAVVLVSLIVLYSTARVMVWTGALIASLF